MTYIPTKQVKFRVVASHGEPLILEPYGEDHEADELRLALDALASALTHLQFTVAPDATPSDTGIPRLAATFPFRRRWVERSTELVLEEEVAGSGNDQFLLLPEQARTWRVRWVQHGMSADVIGDDMSVPPPDLWNRHSAARVEFQSPRIDFDAEGSLVLCGRIVVVNAPSLGRPIEAQVACGGSTTVGSVDSDGHLVASFEPPMSRPAAMGAILMLPVRIETAIRIEAHDITVQTDFKGAAVAVDDSPVAEFCDVIPAGRVPVAVRFASSCYRPMQTSMSLISRRDNKAYEVRLEEAGPDRYRVVTVDPRVQRLLEEELDVRFASQAESAGNLAIVPLAIRGYWSAVEGPQPYQWHPRRELVELSLASPEHDDPTRPQVVRYRDAWIAVDPTAFEALLAKEPLLALSGNVIPLASTSSSPLAREYDCMAAKGKPIGIGKLRKGPRGKYEGAEGIREFLIKKTPVFIQSADGSEQGLLWAPEPIPADLDLYQRISLEAIDAAESRPAMMVFRGILLHVNVRRVQSASKTSDHWMIELTKPLRVPRHVQIEPFLPLMIHMSTDAVSRVLLWQFGETPVPLEIRSDGLLVGNGVGYVFRPRAKGTTEVADKTVAHVGFPPAADEAEVLYCTWRGCLLTPRNDDDAVLFAGWFLHDGEHTYARRIPFDAYRLCRKRGFATGVLTCGVADGADWKWSDSTVPESDKTPIVERVRKEFPAAPHGEAELRQLDAREREMTVGNRRYVLRPAWSTSKSSLQVVVTEQPPDPGLKGPEAVHLFARKKV